LIVSPFKVSGFRSEPLFTEEYVCVLCAGHPLLKGRLSLKRYAAAEHILVAPRAASARGVVDEILARHGLSRRVSRIVTSFAPALSLVEGSDRIVTLPSSFLAVQRPGRGLVTREPPMKIDPIEMEVAWHPQQDGDPRYTWFRALLHEAVRRAGLGVRRS
jgi:DNA-binding transcriptional LysR family regulator